MNPNVQRIIQMRECSRVERCHTLPHHGSYTDGQHSHDAVSLYLVLCPDPSLEVVKAIHVHDYGERWCGDMPAPAKWAAPEIGRALHRLEAGCLERLGLSTTLTTTDEQWLKAVDCLELWLWAYDQLAMGNRNAQAVIDNLNDYFANAKLPEEVRAFLRDYQWTRTSDLLSQP
jgi:hypothetical protein